MHLEISCDALAQPVVLQNAIRLEILPAPLLSVTPRTVNIGCAVPSTNVTTTIRVLNRGSGFMTVTDIQTTAAGTTVPPGHDSFTLAPGAWQDVPVTIATIAIPNGSTIARDVVVVVVVSPGTRLFDPGDASDRCTITGLVSDMVFIAPIRSAPNSNQFEFDVSGNWIVYADGRYGNDDIFAYNTVTGIERRITTDPNAQSTPLEGSPMDVTLTVHNPTSNAVASDITIRLYDGDPDLGGTILTPDRVIAGGLAGYGTTSVIFPATTFGREGVHNVVARIVTLAGENPGNNMASKAIAVQDSDTEGPATTKPFFAECEGDGDSVRASDEQIMIFWRASDPSGIGSAVIAVDGVAHAAAVDKGECLVTLQPLVAGMHSFVVLAADVDDSSTSSEYAGSFDVVNAERIQLVLDGSPVVNCQAVPIDFGTPFQGEPPVVRKFFIRDNGEQRLLLGALSAPVGISVMGPAASMLGPGESICFDLTLLTRHPEARGGSVSIASSDSSVNPYRFAVAGIVLPLPGISGNVWNDLNGNGVQDSGEPPLASWKVFLDADADGQWAEGETLVESDPEGFYFLAGLATGAYSVAAVLPAGWRATSPARDAYTVAYTAGEVVSGRSFCVHRPSAKAGGTYTCTEGGQVVLDASDSSDGANEIVRCEWDLDSDGQYDDATGVTATYQAADEGQFTVALGVVDRMSA
jgi:hypothetical protein